MQKARRHPRTIPCGIDQFGLRPLVGMWFQVHYPPLIGVLPIFRSRYLCTIGRQGVLSLARWTSQIQACFHVSGPTQVPNGRAFLFTYGTVTLYGVLFQRRSALKSLDHSPPLKAARSYNPIETSLDGLGSCPFARRVRQVRNPGINTRLTAPPGLSQSSTPFIASWRQDIPHMPLVAWPQ